MSKPPLDQGADLTRDARVGDLPALLRMRNAPEQFAHYVERTDGHGVRFLVYERNRQVVAFATLFLRQTTTVRERLIPKFSDLHVASGHRSHGIGTAMIAFMEALALAWGHSQMYVGVDAVDNARALALYKWLGYVPIQNAPYQRQAAVWYDEQGNRIPKAYWRLDLVKALREPQIDK